MEEDVMEPLLPFSYMECYVCSCELLIFCDDIKEQYICMDCNEQLCALNKG